MRLLYWAEQFHPYIGGIEVLTAGVLPDLQKCGYSCSVITSKGPLNLSDEDRFESIPVYRFPFRETLESKDPTAINLLARRVGQLETELEPDLAHVFLSDPSCLFHLMARRRFHPSHLVVSVHNSDTRDHAAGRSLLHKVLTEADWVIGNSSFTLDRIHAVLPSCANRSSIIYSGVEIPAVNPGDLTFTPFRIVCVGRLVFEKGFDLVLSALALLLPSYHDAHVQLIGDGPARNALHDLASELGIRHVVEFTGWVPPDRIYEYLGRASVVVIPSRCDETLCQVGIQASLMARPIVAARVGGLSEVVVHEHTGLLIAPNDSSALAEALVRVSSSLQRAKEFGGMARNRALSKFTMPSYLEAVAGLYQRIGGG